MSPSPQCVSVRMYSVGFGDSFLLTFPAPDRPRRVLIDCGVHPAGPPQARPFREVVRQIQADLLDGDEAQVDVVVCSHRHRDHVLGFEDPGWAAVRVGEVWMPWTEHPDDPEARRIRQAQAKKALALHAALAAGGPGDDDALRARSLVENNLTNAAAMATLHGGFAGRPKPRFLPEGRDTPERPLLPQAFTTPSLPGVSVHVLGPGRDQATIRDMDPPSGESFLRAAEGAASLRAVPLDRRWDVSPRGDGFAAWFERMAAAAERVELEPGRPLSREDPAFLPKWFKSLRLGWSDLKKIDRFASESPLLAAVALEQAVNGTSLMLAFEAGRAVLLFPGDAQWGTWEKAIETSRPLLERTSFLKVGHHGSHNASPRTFVEQVLAPDFSAMVSTRETKLYRQIPRIPLLEALAARQRVPAIARSDELRLPPSFRRLSDVCVEALVPV